MPVASRPPSVQHRDVDVDDLRIHFVEIPSAGPPLVMLHGIGMDWRVWQAISRRLSPHFHLYMLDMRGHGQSDKPSHGYSLANYAADIEDFLDLQELNNAVLLGSSLGGMVAASVEAPVDVVRQRILVDPPMTGGPIRDAEVFGDILHLQHEPVGQLADYLGIRNPGSGRLYLQAMSEMWHQASNGVIEDMLARPDDFYAIDSAIQNNDAPTLLMQADAHLGGVLTDEEAARTVGILPRGSVLNFPGAGHAIHAYKPREFARAVVEFTGIDGETDIFPIQRG